MATVIDALVVELGLDPSGFTKGQKDAAAALVKTSSAAEKTGKLIEGANKKASESLRRVANDALDLFAIFLGARGVKEFVAEITRSDAALGRLGVSLNTSPQLISAWGAAAERMGGSASATAGSFQSLSDKIQRLQTAGEALPQAFYQIEAQGGRQIALNKGLGQTFVDLAADLAKIAETDPAKANFLGRQLGIDPETVNLMIANGARVGQIAAGLQRLAPTPAQIQAAKAMQEAWAGLRQETNSLAREIWTDLSPSLVPLLGVIKDMIVSIHDLIHEHQGWGTAIAAVIALWTGAKFFTFLSNVLALKNALLGVGEANAAFSGGGLLGLLGRLGLYGAAAGYVGASIYDQYEHGSAGLGEDEAARHRQQSGGAGGGGPRLTGNDAVRRRGRQAYHDTTNYTGSNAEVVRQAAKELGTTPRDLATVIAYETGGTFSPSIHGGAGGRYQGLIQFGSSERSQFGANDKQSFAEQMPAVVSYLKTRGYKPGMSLLDLYSTINAGSPGHYNASDGNGTVSTHVARMQIEQAGNVRRFLGSGVNEAGSLPSAGAGSVAALNNISNSNTATTSSSSNEMHINGGIHVNAPNVTDAHGVANHIDSALASSMFANFANYGPN